MLALLIILFRSPLVIYIVIECYTFQQRAWQIWIKVKATCAHNGAAINCSYPKYYTYTQCKTMRILSLN